MIRDETIFIFFVCSCLSLFILGCFLQFFSTLPFPNFRLSSIKSNIWTYLVYQSDLKHQPSTIGGGEAASSHEADLFRFQLFTSTYEARNKPSQPPKNHEGEEEDQVQGSQDVEHEELHPREADCRTPLPGGALLPDHVLGPEYGEVQGRVELVAQSGGCFRGRLLESVRENVVRDFGF